MITELTAEETRAMKTASLSTTKSVPPTPRGMLIATPSAGYRSRDEEGGAHDRRQPHEEGGDVPHRLGYFG